MEVPFYGTYDKKMFLEALKLTEKRAVFNTIFRYLALGLAVSIIGATIYAWVLEGTQQVEISRVARNLITASLIGYYYFSGMITRNRSITNLFRSGPERTMHGNVNLEGVTIGTSQQNSTIAWSQFISKGEKGPLLALMTVDGSVAVFHRDFFATEMEWQRFRQFVNQKVIVPK